MTFLGEGTFAHLSRAPAPGRGLKILSCFTIKPLLSPTLLLLPNWLADLLTFFIGCFDSVGAKILPAVLMRLLDFATGSSPPDGRTKS